MKKKLPNKIQDAWDSFFKETAVDELGTYKTEGWKTVEEIASHLGKSISTVHSQVRRGDNFEWKTITALDSRGVARRRTIARLKLKG